MNPLFLPLMRLMRRLPMAHKFGLVCVSFAVPLLFLLYNVVGDRSDALDFSRKEQLGLAHLKQIDGLLDAALAARSSTLVALGDNAAGAGRDAAAQPLETALAGLDKLLSANGDSLGLKPALAKVAAAVPPLQAAKALPADRANEALTAGNALLAAVVMLYDEMAVRSNLALYPDADSYNLMLATLDSGPRLAEALGRAMAVGAVVAGAGEADKAGPELMMAMHNADALLDEYIGRSQAAVERAGLANAALPTAQSLKRLEAMRGEFVELIDEKFPMKGAIGVPAASWLELGGRQLKAVMALRDQTAADLSGVIASRVARLQHQLWFAVGLTLLFCTLAGMVLTAYYVASSSTYAALGRRIQALGAGDLTDSEPLEGRDELVIATNAMRSAVAGLGALVSEVRSGASEISSSAVQISSANQDLSARGSAMATVVEQTSASTNLLEQTVGDNMGSAREAHDLVQSAAALTGRGGQVVNQAVRSMEQITASSRKIGDIIQVIDSIAFQTNILALNAAVEAARAGEQGRGFAVVASEVRSLAQRSASAAREIKTLIQSSIDTVNEGGQYVAQAGSSMTEINEAIQRVTHIVGDISRKSASQAEQIHQLAAAIREVDHSTQQNAALVEETASSTALLEQRAGQLRDAAARFKVPAG